MTSPVCEKGGGTVMSKTRVYGYFLSIPVAVVTAVVTAAAFRLVFPTYAGRGPGIWFWAGLTVVFFAVAAVTGRRRRRK